MNIFVYDEHTPAQAKKQAGRESFLRISSGQTLPLLGDHELAFDIALHDAGMLLRVDFTEKKPPLRFCLRKPQEQEIIDFYKRKA